MGYISWLVFGVALSWLAYGEIDRVFFFFISFLNEYSWYDSLDSGLFVLLFVY